MCCSTLYPLIDPHTTCVYLNGQSRDKEATHGVDNTISWSSHIQAISNRSTKVLNFIKRNLNNACCPLDTKKTAYLTLVRPIMEYAAPVWDPYYNTDIYRLEKVQRRAARWISSKYSRTTCVTSLLSTLNIPTLKQRHQISLISIPPSYQRTQFHTRQ